MTSDEHKRRVLAHQEKADAHDPPRYYDHRASKRTGGVRSNEPQRETSGGPADLDDVSERLGRARFQLAFWRDARDKIELAIAARLDEINVIKLEMMMR